MLPHQKRVVNEKAELDEKIAKLETFQLGDIHKSLSEFDQWLLHDQLRAMLWYSQTLTRRIERFGL